MGKPIAIIPYQVITGNYNKNVAICCRGVIIPYQVITGNYNVKIKDIENGNIIPYQVITGNYNYQQTLAAVKKLYHTK